VFTTLTLFSSEGADGLPEDTTSFAESFSVSFIAHLLKSKE